MKKIYSKIMMLAMMVAALGFAACSSDDDEEKDSGIVENDPSKPIVTGSIESARLSMDLRGYVVCNLYGYCNVLPEVIALSEVGMEIKVKNNDDHEDTFYIPSTAIDSEGRFVVSTAYSKKNGYYQAIPVFYGKSWNYTIRAYIKTGDVYQYGEYRQISIPAPSSLIDQLVVKTGSISEEYGGGLYYKNSCAMIQLAYTYDKSLLTVEKLLEAEEKASPATNNSGLPTYPSDGGTMVWGNLYLCRGDYNVYPATNAPHSSCSVRVQRVSSSSFSGYYSDYYYCEYYYIKSEDGTPIIKMGDIKYFSSY